MGNWADRLNRLKGMDHAEIAARARQFATARADWLRYRTGHVFADGGRDLDIRPLGRFFFTPEDAAALCALLRRMLPAEAADIVSQAHKLCAHRFDLLGYSDLDYGASIDWHLDVVHGKRGPRRPWFEIKYLDFEITGDSKITWELNRHQHFLTLAKAYWLTGNESFVQEIFAQWEQWLRENPYPIGVNWASSLEVAFRSLSWIWTFFLLQGCPLFTPDLQQRWLGMLNLSGRHIETYLSTYFSPNTHLLGEALALFFLGTLFRLPSGRRWQELGWNILVREAGRQVRGDGFHFEQSTYYHVYALDMFLHARILAGMNRIAIPDEFDRTLQRMLNALFLLGRAGMPPMFGDDDGGRLFDPRRIRAEHMLDPLATGAVLYGRGDFKFLAPVVREETIWLLGSKGVADFEALPSTRPSPDSAALADSGLYLMTDAETAQQLVMDAGPLGAGSGGHGHADALSVWLVRKGRNLLRDSGSFEYVGESGERNRLRSTSAHSTMRVDGHDQAIAAGPFSWESFPAVRVRRWIAGQQFDLLEADHDGFSRLPSPITHRRFVFHRKQAFWLVRDVAEGSGRHQFELVWHIGAGLSKVPAEGCDLFAGADGGLAILTAEGHGWSQEIRLENWSPVYGCSQASPVMRLAAARDLPAEFVTVLIGAARVGEDQGRLVRSGEAGESGVSAYQYLREEGEHSFVFADKTGAWTQGSWASDADFLYSQRDRAGRLCLLVLCNGTYAEFEGVRVVSCDRRVSYAEISRTNDKWDRFGPEAEQVRLGPALDGSLR
jgi:hypothetical protein